MATADPRLDPPVSADTLDGLGKHSYAWSNYHQEVADRIDGMPARLRAGVIDGSTAAVGDVGEYLEQSFAGPVSVPTATAVDLGSHTFEAGDWDVWGAAAFTASTSMAMAQVWISQVSATPPGMLGRTVVVVTPGRMLTGTQLQSGVVRVSLAAAAAVYLGAFTITDGVVTAAGALAARRVR